MLSAKRRPHHKSRSGCQSCKERRVKCDELQPRCGNCKARKTECIYQNHRVVTVQSCGKIKVAKGNDFSIVPISYVPVKVNNSMELKLLHQWSTETYKSLITPSNNDQAVWQSHLPQTAFGCEYLLHGVFALSAFEIAQSEQSDYNEWVAIALQYQDQAFRGFREYFNDKSDDSHEAAMYFSLLITILSFTSIRVASKKGRSDVLLQHIVTYYELIRGTQLVLSRNLPFFRTHPLFRNIKSIDQIPRSPLNESTKQVIEDLRAENEKMRSAVNSGGSLDAANQKHRDGCKGALGWLEECFATCLDPYYQMYCEAWVPLAGESYFAALRARDRVALLTLACWATIFQRLGEQAWWAKDYGKELVAEVVHLLSKDKHPETRSILRWAEQELGTPI